jgi:hypothetical protein
MNAGRPLFILVSLAALAGVQSCVTDNPAAYEGILGPGRDPASTTGGSSGSATGGTAGLPTGGTATGGTATGGTAGTSGEGGMGDGGEGTGKGGTAGTGGTGVINPPPHPDFMPPCFLGPTTAGEEILKGTPCTSADPQLCYRPCGPNQSGWKTEECLAGVYAEGDCRFPTDQDYACYKIPDPIDEAACKVTAPPAATNPCDAPACTVCNFGGFYEDSGGDAKEGFCVCREPDAEGVRRWTCASVTAWPCPFSSGC